MTLITISPHLDDAVLSVGQLLAGYPTAVVGTVCTGDPQPLESGLRVPLTEYDRRSGFLTGTEAIATRRAEDRRACSILDVGWEHLGGLDSQYGPALEPAAVVRLLEPLLAAYTKPKLLGPLGLLHPDHVATRQAVLEIGRKRKVPTFLYAELPYRVVEWAELTTTLERVQDGGDLLALTFLGTGDRARKRLAVEQYRSQRWAVEPDHAMVPELVWEVAR